jgi:hypothetical protein
LEALDDEEEDSKLREEIIPINKGPCCDCRSNIIKESYECMELKLNRIKVID